MCNFNSNIHKFLIIVLVQFISVSIFAQNRYKVSDTNIKLTGTSTFHDWEMTSTSGNGTLTIDFDKNGKIEKITNISLSSDVKGLKSESSVMDDNAYRALKQSKNPKILFKGNSTSVTSKDGKTFDVVVSGKLSMAGVSLPIDFVLKAVLNSDGTINIKAEKDMDMTKWKVEPPSFMMDTMKTGKDVKLSFSSTIKK